MTSRHHRIVDYDTDVEWLESFVRKNSRPRRSSDSPDSALEAIRGLLGKLDSPHLGRPTIHVAGSKGKGSTAAMIESILRSAGYTTGMLSSPHLHSYAERIRINGESILDSDFAQFCFDLQKVIETNGNRNLFDILTSIGFYAFNYYDVDIQVIEVGLGGLLDSTNVFKEKNLAVVTSLSYEHTDILGDTIERIAAQKAGIITKDTKTVILAPQRYGGAAKVIRDVAKEKSVPLIDVSTIYHQRQPNVILSTDRTGQDFIIEHTASSLNEDRSRRLFIPLLGSFQIENATTAIAAIDELDDQGFRIPQDKIVAGLENVYWPGRFQVLALSGPIIVVDGAHTEESIRTTFSDFNNYFPPEKDSHLITVFGINKDKPLDKIANVIRENANKIVITQSRHPKKRDAQEIQQYFIGWQGEIIVEQDATKAFEWACKIARPHDRICVLGSLFVASEILESVSIHR